MNCIHLMMFSFDYVQVSVESISGETSPKTINVKIHVGNENGKARSDNIFDDPIYISIPEDTPVGTHIHDIQPISETKTVFNFELFDQMPSTAFELSRNPQNSKSSIKLIRSLDYENDQKYVMTVRVTSDDTNQGSAFSTLLTVVVQIQDVNDIVPTILSSNILTIHSDVKLNVPIMKIISADEDQGDAGKVSYSIVGGNSDQTFQVRETIEIRNNITGKCIYSSFLFFHSFILD